jgi:hypothetical protein
VSLESLASGEKTHFLGPIARAIPEGPPAVGLDSEEELCLGCGEFSYYRNNGDSGIYVNMMLHSAESE